jgi:hypothetical protein
MSATTKVLVPNKSWIVENNGSRLGTLNKEKKGYSFFCKGNKIEIRDLGEVKNYFGIDQLEERSKQTSKLQSKSSTDNAIYEYPCSSKPHNPVYNIIKRLPIYAKSSKSKSLYCAGYYVIQFRKGWVKSFCPKLITLERYPYQGPFKTEAEMRAVLNTVSKQ